VNITICTAHRNSVSHLPRYFAQIERLQKLLTQRGDLLNLVIGYGDSTDGTEEWIFEHCAYSIGAYLIDCTHGGRRFGSIVNDERFKQLAYVANKMWANIPPDSDVAMLVDGDLIWKPETLLALIDHTHTYPCVAPMVLHEKPFNRRGDRYFYDSYAFVCQGTNFINGLPYHHALPSTGSGTGGMLQMDSVGACVAIRGELARRVRFPEYDVFVGWCRQVRELGGAIFLDSRLSVFHP
jgi:GT2 family glycosyltransferase